MRSSFPLFLVLEQLIGDHEGLIISLLYRLFDAFIVSISEGAEAHLLHLQVHLLIYLEIILFLQGVAPGNSGVEWHLGAYPWMGEYFVDADAFVGVHLQHASDEVGSKRVDGVRDEVVAL